MSPDQLQQDLDDGVPLEDALVRHSRRQSRKISELSASTLRFFRVISVVIAVALAMLFAAAAVEVVIGTQQHNQGAQLRRLVEQNAATTRTLQRLVDDNAAKARAAAKQSRLACIRSRTFAPDFSRLLRYGVDASGRRLVRAKTVSAYLKLIPAGCP